MNPRGGGGLCLSVCSWVWITGLFIILIKALLLLLLLLLMVNHWICFYHSSPVYSLPGTLCYHPCNSRGYENCSPIKYHHHPLWSLSNPHPRSCIGIHPRHSNHHPQSRLWGCDGQHRNAIIITIRGLVCGPYPIHSSPPPVDQYYRSESVWGANKFHQSTTTTIRHGTHE